MKQVNLWFLVTIIWENTVKLILFVLNLLLIQLKALLSLILFSALLLKMGGFYAILSYERHEIRENVEHKIIKSLKKSELICIIANAENLSKIVWERPQKEFRFNGNLYDIAYLETISGINYYYCLTDKAETKLELKINKLFNNQTQNMPLGDNAKLILYLLVQPLIAHQNPSFYFNYFSPEKASVFPNLIIFHASDFVSKLKQPPQLS